MLLDLLQACYCCEECRDSAWEQYHKTLCLRSFTPDPSHPLVMLQEAWKLVFILLNTLTYTMKNLITPCTLP